MTDIFYLQNIIFIIMYEISLLFVAKKKLIIVVTFIE